jgi:hypothetical protein
LLQVEAALVPLRQGMLSWLAPGAPIVLTAACAEGLGYHGLFGPGGRLFRKPSRKTFLNDHPLILFLPGVSEAETADVFWEGYAVCSTWDAVVSRLSAHIGGHPTVGIVPCAPLQVADAFGGAEA